MRVLILAAHNDDETLGCGATIARLAEDGHEVQVLVLGEGPTARRDFKVHVNAALNSVEAIKSLGATLCGMGMFPDNRFDEVAVLEIARRVEITLEKFRPDVVYTHHIGDLNQDHRAVAHATMIATRTYASSVKQVYMYEVPGATGHSHRRKDAFVPNVYQEITMEQLEKKIQAMEMYESERRPYPHPRSPEKLRAKAEDRGAEAGVPLAEAFELVRSVR